MANYRNNSNNSGICQFYQKGTCKYGLSCRYKHVDTNDNTQNDSNSIANFTNPLTLGQKEKEIKDDIASFKILEQKPVLSSYGLQFPATANLIAGRDVSLEELRLQYLEAQALGTMQAYETQMAARTKDMEYCVGEIRNRELLAARYLQVSATKTPAKPFIPKTLEENLQQFSQPSAFGGQGFGNNGGSVFGNSQPSSAFGKPSTSGFGAAGFGASASAGNKPSAFGSSAFGSSGFGSASTTTTPTTNPFGGSSTTPASNPFGGSSSAFGSAGFGALLAKPDTTNSTSAFGSTGFGQLSTNQAGSSAFGNSGFGSTATKSAFGSSSFGNATTSSTASNPFGSTTASLGGFGSLGFGNVSKPAPFGASQPLPFGTATTSNPLPFGTTASSTTNPINPLPFGATSALPFGAVDSTKPLPFGNAAATNSTALPFGNAAATNTTALPFGKAAATKTTALPFGNANTFNSSSSASASPQPFGMSNGTSVPSTGGAKEDLAAATTYTEIDLSTLKAEISQAFNAPEFQVGHIPDIPPPRSLCA